MRAEVTRIEIEGALVGLAVACAWGFGWYVYLRRRR